MADVRRKTSDSSRITFIYQLWKCLKKQMWDFKSVKIRVVHKGLSIKFVIKKF